MRLNQYLAQYAGLSRRSADTVISQGRVKFNGQKAQIGQLVAAEDSVALDGEQIKRTEPITLLFHKPTGYICSRIKQGKSPTIYDLINRKYHHLKPAGRLDKDSSGLLILTSDGKLAHRITHPSFAKWKEYEIETDRKLQESDLKKIQSGIMLEDGLSKFEITANDTHYTIRLQEGRNRQIRRTLAALGITVRKLHRLKVGDTELGELKAAAYREIKNIQI